MKKQKPKNITLATISGTIHSIKYRNSENWSVFTVAQNPILLTNCTGILPEMVKQRDHVTCTGQYTQSLYGQQLKCSEVIPAPPDIDSEAGVVLLLQRLPSIGPAKAKQAVKEYGHKEAWNIALTCPSMLGIVDQETAIKAQQVAIGLISSFETITYLLSIGLTDNQANKIIGKYGINKAAGQVQQNPYQLIEDIDGFGFRTVDKIALKAGMKIDSETRIMACVLYCLLSSEHNEGNIWFSGWKLAGIVREELQASMMAGSIPTSGGAQMPGKEDVRKCIYGLQSEGKVVIDKGRVYLKELLDAEKTILGRLEG